MLNWKNTIMASDARLSEAIQLLERDDNKIVLVADEVGRLIGTITDGDIRRALLKGYTLKDNISGVMNSNPKAVALGEDKDVIRSRMESLRIRQIPIVDKDGVIHGLETLKHLADAPKRANPVFIMAGGSGRGSFR